MSYSNNSNNSECEGDKFNNELSEISIERLLVRFRSGDSDRVRIPLILYTDLIR